MSEYRSVREICAFFGVYLFVLGVLPIAWIFWSTRKRRGFDSQSLDADERSSRRESPQSACDVTSVAQPEIPSSGERVGASARLRKVIARKVIKSRAQNYEPTMVTVSIEDLESVLAARSPAPSDDAELWMPRDWTESDNQQARELSRADRGELYFINRLARAFIHMQRRVVASFEIPAAPSEGTRDARWTAYRAHLESLPEEAT